MEVVRDRRAGGDDMERAVRKSSRLLGNSKRKAAQVDKESQNADKLEGRRSRRLLVECFSSHAL